MTVELIDPRVKAILEEFARMNLIKIREEEVSSKRFSVLLSKLRSKEEAVPDMDEITKEVELVRSLR
ncbi:MAG: hypothetical protein R2784_21440 [Saprospiraceae bacterium]